jgi:hypothetical protein
MKSLNTLLATLIIGSSSLAFAEPVVRDHRDFAGGTYDTVDHYNDHRWTDDRDHRPQDDDRFDRRGDYDGYRMRFRRMPVSLAQNLQLDMRNPAYISLDQRGGGIRRLRIDADEGRAFIDSVILRFADGSYQPISVRQRISGRSQPLTLEIDSRATGVYIYGRTRGRGSLDVVGLRR